jgi:arylsulfatase A-like enzyme
MDWSNGVILNELKKSGLAENTLVIFTSDNGARTTEGGSNTPLRGTKGSTWEGGLRVSCLMYWPGTIPAGVCDGIATSMDLYPTLARLAGASLPTDRTIDGVDMQPLLAGQSGAASKRETFFYYARDALCAVRHRNWKLHVGRNPIHQQKYEQVFELYDLDADIGETNNLYENKPDIVKQLTALIEQCRIDLGDSGTGIIGKNTRPIGRVENPKPLTEYNPEHPYYAAIYDLDEVG